MFFITFFRSVQAHCGFCTYANDPFWNSAKVYWFLMIPLLFKICIYPLLYDDVSYHCYDISSYQFCEQHCWKKNWCQRFSDIIVTANSILVLSMVQSLVTFWHQLRIPAGEYFWTFYCSIFCSTKGVIQIIFLSSFVSNCSVLTYIWCKMSIERIYQFLKDPEMIWSQTGAIQRNNSLNDSTLEKVFFWSCILLFMIYIFNLPYCN